MVLQLLVEGTLGFNLESDLGSSRVRTDSGHMFL